MSVSWHGHDSLYLTVIDCRTFRLVPLSSGRPVHFKSNFNFVMSAITTSAVIVGSAASLAAGAFIFLKKEERREKEKEKLRRNPFPTEVDLSVAVMKQIILARLVIGVYDKASEKPGFYEWGDRVHYSEVSIRHLFAENKDLGDRETDVPTRGEFDAEDKRKYIIVYRKTENSVAEFHGAKWVVACRGTKKRRIHDVNENKRLYFRNLHKSKISSLCLKIVKLLCKLYGAENVCVAGHSLGAAFCMHVWRTLALEHELFVASYLFNPPSGSAEAILLFYGCAFVSHLNLHYCTVKCLRHCVSKTLQVVGKYLGDSGLQLEDSQEIEILRRAVPPEVYINENDPLSGGFTKRLCFEERNSGGGGTGASLSGMSRNVTNAFRKKMFPKDSKDFTRMPCAKLNIARQPKYLLAPHKLINWHRHDVVVESRMIKCEFSNY